MTATSNIPTSAVTPEEIVQRYVEDEGPTKGLVHAQNFNGMMAEALAAHISSSTELRSPADCDRAVDSDESTAFFVTWAKATDNRIYDTITYKQEQEHDEDGNVVTRQVPTPHKINVSSRLDKFGGDIRVSASKCLKKSLRDNQVAFPQHNPDAARFLTACHKLLPNVEDPAQAATVVRTMIENVMANRGVDGARRQQMMVYQEQPTAGGGGKNLFMSGLEEYGRGIGLLMAPFNPAETHFVSDNAGYADILYCAESPRIPKEAYATINNIVDNTIYLSERKHCDPEEVLSVATVVINSNYDYPDCNNRRVGLITYAANRIYNLAKDDEQYWAVYHPTRVNKYTVRFKSEDNEELKEVWNDLFSSVEFGAVYEDPTSVTEDRVVLDHQYLKALKIMEQVRDADAQDGTYNDKYNMTLGCRPKTEYRDLDHCIQCLVKAEIIDKTEKRETRALLAQLVLEASRRGLIPGKGRKADRIKFGAYDFARCTVDAADAEEGYTYTAISNRWDRLIAAYTEAPQDPTGGKSNDDGRHTGDEEKREEHQADAVVGMVPGEPDVAAASAGVVLHVHDHESAQLQEGVQGAADQGRVDATCLDKPGTDKIELPATLACTSKYDKSPVSSLVWWQEHTQAPEFVVAGKNLPGCTGRKRESIIPTYMVFESDSLPKEAQIPNIKPEGLKHVTCITWSGNKSYHMLVRLDDNDAAQLAGHPTVYKAACRRVASMIFSNVEALDENTWTIGRLSRYPFGHRLDNGNVQECVHYNAESARPEITDFINKELSKEHEKLLRAVFFKDTIIEDEKEALEKLDHWYDIHSTDGTITDELDLAHEVLCCDYVSESPGENWLGGLNCLRGYHMPRKLLETYLDRVRTVHPTHLPQDNDYYLENYGKEAV